MWIPGTSAPESEHDRYLFSELLPLKDSQRELTRLYQSLMKKFSKVPITVKVATLGVEGIIVQITPIQAHFANEYRFLSNEKRLGSGSTMYTYRELDTVQLFDLLRGADRGWYRPR